MSDAPVSAASVTRLLCAVFGWLVMAGATEEGAAPDRSQLEAGAPYVPSPHGIVAEMLELGGVGPDDYVIDLGSGDGRIVLTAAELFGARGLGVEIRQDLVERSRRAAEHLGVTDRVRFVQQDLFETNLSDATVVTVYLLPETLRRLRSKLLWELEPGTRVISHDYPIEHWAPERFVQLEHPDKVEVTGVARTNLYLYRVPADVTGRWSARVPARLAGHPLQLEFAQRLTVAWGRTWIGGNEVRLEDVSLSGRRLAFTLPGSDARFTGRLKDGILTGTVDVAGARTSWRATRN